jgi:hypothetical protein
MRKRLPLATAGAGVVCMIVAAALSLTWGLGASRAEGGATTSATIEGSTSPEPTAESYAESQATIQASNESCFWARGKIKWCLDGWEGDEWSIWEYEGRAHVGRYYVHNHKDEVLGYLRPSGRPRRWRAMVSVCFADARPCGWARGGKVVRASRNAYHIYKKGRRVGTARGPAAIAVAAYKLVIGDCITFC